MHRLCAVLSIAGIFIAMAVETRPKRRYVKVR